MASFFGCQGVFFPRSSYLVPFQRPPLLTSQSGNAIVHTSCRAELYVRSIVSQFQLLLLPKVGTAAGTERSVVMHQVSRDKMVGWELSGVAISWSLDEPKFEPPLFAKRRHSQRQYLPTITTRHPSAENYGQNMTHKMSDVRAEKANSGLRC
jgi:hypothetical protein